MGLELAAVPEDELSGIQNRPAAAKRLWMGTVLAALFACGAAAAQTAEGTQSLPNAPSPQVSQPASEQTEEADGRAQSAKSKQRSCRDSDYPTGDMPLQGPPPCIVENPLEPVVTSVYVKPLSSKEKGELAVRDFLDPFNFVAIAGYSALVIATNSHTAYGSGFNGFGKLTGYGLAQDAQGEFMQTYAISSMLHEDPRYHRMPTGSVKRRIWHAIEHTYVTRHDDGRPMPNYANLLTYPLSAELSNLYVPGIQRDAPATAQRIAIGIATDPAGAIVAEFLPDVAKRVHIHILFVQEILNQAIVGSPNVQ